MIVNCTGSDKKLRECGSSRENDRKNTKTHTLYVLTVRMINLRSPMINLRMITDDLLQYLSLC